MHCLNCNTSITSERYCPNCGARIIRNRLSLKAIFSQINREFFSVDNKLFKTLLHLITKPQDVIVGYIDGLRKKYVDAIPFLAIAVTILGFQFFILKEFFPEVMSVNYTPTGNAQLDAMNSRINEFVFDYLGVITIVTLPMLALFTFLLFASKKTYNFTEHIVMNIYVTGEYTILVVLINLIGLSLGISFVSIVTFTSLLSYGYVIYSFKKIFNSSYFSSFWRVLLALIMQMLIVGILVVLAGIIYGIMNPDILKPVN